MDKTVSRRYFNEQADHWDEMPRSNEPERLQAMVDRLSISPNSWILDVGTGTGILLPYLSNKLNGNGRIVCVDFAFQMLTKAKTRSSNGFVAFACSEIETIHFNGKFFDAAVCYSTFPHFHDKPGALANIHRVLKPGGQIFICHTASRKTINTIHQNIPEFRDHLVPEREDMKMLLANAGFRDIVIIEDEFSYLTIANT